MKSFPKIIQETQFGLPPHNKVKFFGHGFRNREKREEDDERKEQKKSSFKSEF